ncbi:chorismate lyase [Sinobacterium caligoides]|uniref:Probable chorismate pyruvate-lyase n=1 Tax=Sinobacterium caligoides TaxID=933926 RepID=A0A3N2DH13_9GAMM|nr:chorismate lyase [Sinobacterium caligoides]ROR99085.1 chorismate lyase [Sinobacterium caligoides]
MNTRIFYDHCQSHYQPNTDHWRNHRQFRLETLCSATRRWLLDESSLTQRLIRASNNHFRVELLRQDWGRPTLSEARALNISPRQICLIREVALLCHDQPWVYARSIIPHSTLSGRYRALKYLQTTPLGQWLFNEKSMRRHSFEVAQIASDSRLLPENLQGQGKLWGRRSKFELSGKPLLVCEVFLNNFIPETQTSDNIP